MCEIQNIAQFREINILSIHFNTKGFGTKLKLHPFLKKKFFLKKKKKTFGGLFQNFTGEVLAQGL